MGLYSAKFVINDNADNPPDLLATTLECHSCSHGLPTLLITAVQHSRDDGVCMASLVRDTNPKFEVYQVSNE